MIMVSSFLDAKVDSERWCLARNRSPGIDFAHLRPLRLCRYPMTASSLSRSSGSVTKNRATHPRKHGLIHSSSLETAR